MRKLRNIANKQYTPRVIRLSLIAAVLCRFRFVVLLHACSAIIASTHHLTVSDKQKRTGKKKQVHEIDGILILEDDFSAVVTAIEEASLAVTATEITLSSQFTSTLICNQASKRRGETEYLSPSRFRRHFCGGVCCNRNACASASTISIDALGRRFVVTTLVVTADRFYRCCSRR
jgi:hypothetical protein